MTEVPVAVLHRAHKAAEAAGVPNAKITAYANCIGISFRNGDGIKVLATVAWDADEATITHKVRTLLAVRPQNIPSDETLAKLKD